MVLGVLLGMVLLVVTTGIATAGTEVKQVPLEWEDISHNDGASMYGSLCATCHGAGGTGNGTAAAELDKAVPDLSALSRNHGGTYPHGYVVDTIYGDSRTLSHGGLDMPDWGKQFMYAGKGWHSFPRRKLASDRINTLADYVETLQVN
jgi:mono/diheme cytochrome c family protein